jgi:hypothetical protein
MNHGLSSLLSMPEVELFSRLSPADQWHSYAVLSALQSAGDSHPDLLSAALLHDVGKSRVRLSTWERSITVLAHALFPGRSICWGQSEAIGWRRPFVVRQKHAEWGAEMLMEAGSRHLTITLVRRHQERLSRGSQAEEDVLLRRLQWADELN